MGIIKFIPENQVLPLALRLVRQSKKSLYLTMMMREELRSVSKDYLDTLREKIKQKIVVNRVGFGTKQEYKEALRLFEFKRIPPNFSFRYLPLTRESQRLLISDEKEMVFAVYLGKKKKLVFYTDYKPIIKAFLTYFKENFKKAKIERR